MTGFVLAVLITVGSDKSVCPPHEQTMLEKQATGVYLEVPRPTDCQWIYEEREEEWTADPERGGTFTKVTKPKTVKPRPSRKGDPKPDDGR